MPYIGYKSNLNGGRVLYWVGGTATWDSTAGTKWALTSGGVGGEPVPTSIDDVYFDGNSGFGTVTLSSASICHSASFWGYTGTLSHGLVTWQIYGALIFGAGMTYTLTSNSDAVNIDFKATSGAWYIVTAGKTMSNAHFNGAGSWVLYDSYTANRRIYVDNGSLYTNGQSVTALALISDNTNTRTVSLGSSTLTLGSSTGFEFWGFSTVTNLTFDAGTSTINGNPVVGGNTVFNGGGLTYNDVSINPTVGNSFTSITGANTFRNLTIINTHNAPSETQIGANQVITNELYLSGNTQSLRMMISSSSYGTQRTLTAGIVTAANVDFRDIAGAGAANWDLSGIPGRSGDCFGNSGITFSTPRTVYWFKDSGAYTSDTQWFTLSAGGGSLASCPLPQDTGVYDINSFSAAGKTVTATIGTNTVQLRVGTLNFTGVTNTPAWTSGAIEAYGSLTMVSGMTHTANVGDTWQWMNRNAQTLTSGGLTWSTSAPMGAFLTSTGSLTQQDNFRMIDRLDLSSGEWITGNNTLRSGFIFVATNGTTGVLTTGSGLLTADNSISIDGGTTTIGSGGVTTPSILLDPQFGQPITLNMGSGTWTLTGTGNVWNIFSGNTVNLNAETSTILYTDTSASTKTFANGGVNKTYYNLQINGAAGAGTVTIASNNTFNNITFDPNSNIRLTASKTQTINGAITATGTLGNTIVVRSTSGTNATISSAAGAAWAYTTLTNLTGTGGGVFAAINSTDGGGNVNWTITP
jgi:hypothetical protein